MTRRIPRKVLMFISVMGLAVAVGLVLYFTLGGGASAHVMVEAAQVEKTRLLDSLSSGRVLFYRMEDFQSERLGLSDDVEYPQRVMDKTWMLVGDDGDTDRGLTLTYDLAGNLISRSDMSEGDIIYADFLSGETMTFPLGDGSNRLSVWIEHSWNMEGYTDSAGFTRQGSGRLLGRDSTIYRKPVVLVHGEGATETVTFEIEFVDDAPLLNRQAQYDDEGNLTYENTLVEYSVIDTMPK